VENAQSAVSSTPSASVSVVAWLFSVLFDRRTISDEGAFREHIAASLGLSATDVAVVNFTSSGAAQFSLTGANGTAAASRIAGLPGNAAAELLGVDSLLARAVPRQPEESGDGAGRLSAAGEDDALTISLATVLPVLFLAAVALLLLGLLIRRERRKRRRAFTVAQHQFEAEMEMGVPDGGGAADPDGFGILDGPSAADGVAVVDVDFDGDFDDDPFFELQPSVGAIEMSPTQPSAPPFPPRMVQESGADQGFSGSGSSLQLGPAPAPPTFSPLDADEFDGL
jgi:hypothetical protein